MRTLLDVMCPEKQQSPVQAGVRAPSLTQRVAMQSLFLHRTSISPCEFVHLSHNTQTPWAGVCIIYLGNKDTLYYLPKAYSLCFPFRSVSAHSLILCMVSYPIMPFFHMNI